MSWMKTRFIAYGFLLGTAGVKALTSQEAKDVYTKVTSLGFRCADGLMKTVQTLRENCEDIVADAKAINEEKYRAADERKIEEARAILESAKEQDA